MNKPTLLLVVHERFAGKGEQGRLSIRLTIGSSGYKHDGRASVSFDMLNLRKAACHHARKETGHAERRRKFRRKQFVKQQEFQQQECKQDIQQLEQQEQQRKPRDVLVRTQPWS